MPSIVVDVPILYEDEHLLVVDKPAGVLVVPAPGRSGPTVVDLLRREFAQREPAPQGRTQSVHAVHRLDEETTGALALALGTQARTALEQIFRRHAARRTYLAILSRVPSPAAGRIESFLIERPSGVVASTPDGRGRRAVTHYRTLGRTSLGAVVELELETGRRNQIRVHMADIGCPVVGDRKYGDRARGAARRQPLLLHAWKLAFRHPFSGASLEVVAEPPAGFDGALSYDAGR